MIVFSQDIDLGNAIVRSHTAFFVIFITVLVRFVGVEHRVWGKRLNGKGDRPCNAAANSLLEIS